jgi:hypothetical protein
LEQLRVLREKLAAEAKELEGQLKKAGDAKRLEAVAGTIETYQDDEDALGGTGRKRSRRKDSNSRQNPPGRI